MKSHSRNCVMKPIPSLKTKRANVLSGMERLYDSERPSLGVALNKG